MNCQKNIFLNCSNTHDSIISDNRGEAYTWKIVFLIDEIKSLFKDLNEITKENFPQLSKHISLLISIIDKINRNMLMKPITPNSSILGRTTNTNKSIYETNNTSILSDRISLPFNAGKSNISPNKKNENILEIVKRDIIPGLNKLFEVPYLYILFSKRFRDIFKIYNVYNLNKDYCNEEQYLENGNCYNYDYNNYRSESSNSNQSILENLLN